jgi:two-component system response regulator PilR (NtrC family)
MPGVVLVVDDENLLREDLALLLRREGYECATAPSAEEALEQIPQLQPDVVITDIVMPGMSGVDLIDKVLGLRPDTAVIVMTAFGTLETAIDAFRRGAADYVLKPLVSEDIISKVDRIFEHMRLTSELSYLRRRVNEVADSLTLIGNSEPMRRVEDLIDKVAPTRSTVLTTGESGTGKELVARAVHERGTAAEHPFIAINCSGLQENLLQSELFGHVKGAFTGAIQDKVGLFEAAGKGTVLLDEISEMPPDLQSKLLRVLEQREFLRVGGTVTLAQRARVVAATNRDLKAMIATGKFREDLYYRIAVFEIPLPALRDRATDIPPLVDYFVAKFNHDMKRNCQGVEPDALEALTAYEWPGNIRELRNVVERALILCTGARITRECLPPPISGLASVARSKRGLKEAVQSYEATLIRRSLDETGWNKEETARRLLINPSTLYRKMADLGIERHDDS